MPTHTPDAASAVRHLPERQRLKLWADGQRCRLGDLLAIHSDGALLMPVPHTGVPPLRQGQDLVPRLMAAAMAEARTRGWQVQPLCNHARTWLRRHPEAADRVDLPAGH